MPVAIIAVDFHGRILLTNARAQRLFGYSADELTAESIERLIPERFRKAHVVLRSDYAAAPSERSMGVGRELYGRHKDATEFPIDVGLNPVASRPNAQTLVTIIDASERKIFEEYRLRRTLDLQRRTDLENELAREHRLTYAMQTAFLPRAFPPVHGIVFESLYRPPTDDGPIGGDWHDAFLLPNGSLGFTIGDVTGHGLESAIAMIRIRETLRSIALSTGKTPATVLEITNRIVAEMPNIITTALVAHYDAARRRLTIASAGHPAPIRVRNQVATPLVIGGILLGAANDSTYTDVTIELLPGDVIAFYTDGLIEAERRPVEGEANLLEALAAYRFDGLEALVDALLTHGQPDDGTLVLMSMKDDKDTNLHR